MKELTNAQIIESVGRVASILGWDLKEVWVSDGLKCVYQVIEDGVKKDRFFLFSRAITQPHLEAGLLDEMFSAQYYSRDSGFTK